MEEALDLPFDRLLMMMMMIMKVQIVLFLASRHFVDLKPKYLPQHSAFEKPSGETSQLHNGSCVFVCPGAHKIKNKGVAAYRQHKVPKLLILCTTTQNFRHFMFPGVSLTLWRRNYFFFNFSTSCI